ncbi:MAG: FkbM family methyltransferase [Selenomonas ruminantium]|uniref:FkbM family methyltransferase n=1 Tax=Selenomonas ruminantium TaxID=971 RepID=A0A927ZRQ0_SELRU|nr:FkbM family methyltransferase [Selenomonas ruminantium]
MELASLNAYLEELRRSDVIIYGAGSKGKQALELLRRYGVEPTAVCDSDKNKWGSDFGGLRIDCYEEVRPRLTGNVFVLLTVSNGFVREVKHSRPWGRDIVKQLCIPFKVEVDLLSDEDMASCRMELEESYSSLADDISRQIFVETVAYKVTGDYLPLFDYLERTEPNLGFFDTELLPKRSDHVYVDVGAFTGDSLLSFAMAVRGSYQKIVAFEGDKGIYESLCDMLLYARLPRVSTVNKLLHSGLEEMNWYTVANNKNILFDSSNLYEKAEVIFSSGESMSHGPVVFGTEKVYTDTLDNCLQVSPTVLKVNAMAADFDILRGGRETIGRCKPMLCLEFGVRKQDVGKLIPLIKDMNPDYRFYLRVKEIYGDFKTVLYAV